MQKLIKTCSGWQLVIVEQGAIVWPPVLGTLTDRENEYLMPNKCQKAAQKVQETHQTTYRRSPSESSGKSSKQESPEPKTWNVLSVG